MNKLSVIIPVYNEEATILELIRRVRAQPMVQEILVVNDGSTDRTAELLLSLGGDGLTVLRHEENRGKGAAIRTALNRVTGDVVLIQDADLEYNPKDYAPLLEPILDGRADVVYGSRFLGGPHRVLFFWHYLGNLIFTLLVNIIYNVNLSDMGTCYKAFRADILKSLVLKSEGFGFEPEVTAKICKKQLRIYETPISYSGRTYEEGKKIKLLDGLIYLWNIFWYRFFD